MDFSQQFSIKIQQDEQKSDEMFLMDFLHRFKITMSRLE